MASASNILLIICFTFTSPSCISSASTDPKGFFTNLIHIKSPYSPYRDIVQTESQDEDMARKSSLARHAYLSARQKEGQQPTDYLPPPLVSGGIMYLANLSLGDPPTNVYAIADTGSDLFWVQCEPCDVCYNQTDPIYYRDKSQSYTEMSCDTSFCESLGNNGECTNHAERYCAYKYSYADGTRTVGLLSLDMVGFSSHYSSEDKTTQVGFGCGIQNYNTVPGYRDGGVLGLGPGELSLVSQLAKEGKQKKTFAYCIGNLGDPKSPGYLVFGDEKYLEGDKTPMQVDEFYYVTVTGISFDGEKLKIDPALMRRKADGSGGVIVDSGSTLTFLAEGVYGVVRGALTAVMKELYNMEPFDDQDRCYQGRIGKLQWFPLMNIYFEGGAFITYDRWSTFHQVRADHFCLSFDGRQSLSVIGLRSQQFHSFGYDLEAKTLSISPVSKCL